MQLQVDVDRLVEFPKITAALGLLLLLLSFSQACAGSYSYSPSANLEEAWRREFGVITPPFGRTIPQDAHPISVMLDGQERKELVGVSMEDIENARDKGKDSKERRDLDNAESLVSHGTDIKEWLRRPPDPLRYVELYELAASELAAFGDETLAQVTHLRLISGYKLEPSVEDLKFIRDRLPNLVGLSIELSTIGRDNPGVDSLERLVEELAKLGNVEELVIKSYNIPQHVMRTVSSWVSSLKKLRRLQVSGLSEAQIWTEDLFSKLGGIEWLSAIAVPRDLHVGFWNFVAGCANLRCLGVGIDTGYNPERLTRLKGLKYLVALSLYGTYKEGGTDLCNALNQLQQIKHIHFPSLTYEEDWEKTVKPMRLTSLHSISVPDLNQFSIKWLQAQSGLVELRTKITGYKQLDETGLLAGLAELRSLQTLKLFINLLPKNACKGLASLPLRTLLLDGAIKKEQEPDLLLLLNACSAVETLVLSVGYFDSELPEPLSDKIFAVVANRKALKTLAVRLPNPKVTILTLGLLPKLSVLCDLGGNRSKEFVNGIVGSAKQLEMLVLPGLPDELATSIQKKLPNLLLLRDLLR